MAGLRKVHAGDPLVVRASDWNAILDVTRAQSPQLGIGAEEAHCRQNTVVLVRNDSGGDRLRLAVLGIDGPIITPTDNLEEFKRRVVLKGVVPVAGTHDGKFVILAEPLADGKIGRAYVDGVCPVRLKVRYTNQTAVKAEQTQDVTRIELCYHGSATILWREGGVPSPPFGELEEWAIVRLGRSGYPTPSIFPIKLVQDGGSQGTATTPATWSYRYYDLQDEPLWTGETYPFDPAVWGAWRRPAVGRMTPATWGLAYQSIAGVLFVMWINEVAEQEACP